MKKIFFGLIVFLILSSSVSAYSFNDFFNDIGELITGMPIVHEPVVAPVPSGGGSGRSEQVVIERCSDKTIVGECNENNRYCTSDKNLISDCDKCGSNPGNECNTETKEEVIYVNCASASGVCDVGCTNGFKHVSRLDNSCQDLIVDVVPVDFIGLAVGSWQDKEKKGELVCCVPIREVDNFLNVTLANLTNETVFRVIQDREFESLSCVEGTEHGNCLDEKPFYCQGGLITSFCGYCGCPEDEICNLKSNVCVKAIPVESVQIIKEFLNLGDVESNIVEDALLDVSAVIKSPVVPIVDYIPDKREVVIKLDAESVLILGFDRNGLPKIIFDIDD